MPEPKFGIDTDVMKYLMNQHKPRLPSEEDEPEISPNMAAVMADAAAKMGTIGGQQADARPVAQFAQGLNRQQEKADSLTAGRDSKIANYLMGLQKSKQARDMQLADRAEGREFQKGKTDEARLYAQGQAAKKRRLGQQDLAERREYQEGQAADKRKQGILDRDEGREYQEIQRKQKLEDYLTKESEKLKNKKEYADYKGNLKDGAWSDAGMGNYSSNELNKALGGKKLHQREEKAIKQVAYRYEVMRSNLTKLDNLIKDTGTFELTGPEATQMDTLIYELAIDFSKLVDPDSVAREGEVKLAKEYLLPIRNWGGLSLTNETARDLVVNFKTQLDKRLTSKLNQYNLGGLEIVQSLAKQADELPGTDGAGVGGETAIAGQGQGTTPDEDNEAMKWAEANPNDPRAKAILRGK